MGPNYLQLSVNQPKAPVATNQRDGQMAHGVDDPGENPHVNYEPSITGGLREAEGTQSAEQGPVLEGRLTRARIPRTNDYKQAGERYQLSEDWEKDDLVFNLVDALSECDRPIQERMVWHLLMVEDELGLRVARASRSRSTTCAASSLWPRRSSPTRSTSGWPTSGRTGLAT